MLKHEARLARIKAVKFTTILCWHNWICLKFVFHFIYIELSFEEEEGEFISYEDATTKIH